MKTPRHKPIFTFSLYDNVRPDINPLIKSLSKTEKEAFIIEHEGPYRQKKFIVVVASKRLSFTEKEWKYVWWLSTHMKFYARFYVPKKHFFRGTTDEIKVWLVEYALNMDALNMGE